MQIERMGVNPKWVNRWKSVLRNAKGWNDGEFNNNTLAMLQEYAQTGDFAAQIAMDIKYDIKRHPDFKSWMSSYLTSALMGYAAMRAFEFEKQSLQSRWDSVTASRSFTSAYYGQCVKLSGLSYFKSPPEAGALTHSLTDIPFTALGIIIGCKEEATKLACMQLVAYRKGYYKKKYYPIYCFVLRIMADYMNQPPLELCGEPLNEPVFNALFDHWRTSDLDNLTSICLAACDFHTHRCKPDVRDEWNEFANGEWHKFPFEILLVFKLRQLLGLSNPAFDHPLMNTPLGVLPTQDAIFTPDELITRVRARMVQDGFDEQLIYETVLAS